mmetsp:Transcript_49569/g.142663  ORF Transcript_49569/g.142663 Transcript_49569/m.142663 type:complete len:240 (+) Transcript_49569:723-1442(+)
MPELEERLVILLPHSRNEALLRDKCNSLGELADSPAVNGEAGAVRRGLEDTLVRPRELLQVTAAHRPSNLLLHSDGDLREFLQVRRAVVDGWDRRETTCPSSLCRPRRVGAPPSCRWSQRVRWPHAARPRAGNCSCIRHDRRGRRHRRRLFALIAARASAQTSGCAGCSAAARRLHGWARPRPRGEDGRARGAATNDGGHWARTGAAAASGRAALGTPAPCARNGTTAPAAAGHSAKKA